MFVWTTESSLIFPLLHAVNIEIVCLGSDQGPLIIWLFVVMNL